MVDKSSVKLVSQSSVPQYMKVLLAGAFEIEKWTDESTKIGTETVQLAFGKARKYAQDKSALLELKCVEIF